MTKTKKGILKKACGGKGGVIGDTIKNGYKKIKEKVGGTKTKVKDAITKGIVNFVGDTKAGNILREGLEKQKNGNQ